MINGSQPIVTAFGGVALAGRFQWTVMPMLLAWSPFFLKRLEAYRQRLIAVAVVVSALWVVQAVPILIGDHNYFNATFPPFAPWDPTLYPGWWDWVNSYLPSVVTPFSRVVAEEVLFEAVLVVALTWLLVRLVQLPTDRGGAQPQRRCGRRWSRSSSSPSSYPAGPSPSTSLTWTGQSLGGPWTTTDSRLRTAPAALVDVGTGTYEVTVIESVNSASGSTSRLSFLTTPIQRILVSNWFSLRHPTTMVYMSVAPAPLDLAQEHVSTLVLPPSTSTRQTTLMFSTSAASRPSRSAWASGPTAHWTSRRSS